MKKAPWRSRFWSLSANGAPRRGRMSLIAAEGAWSWGVQVRLRSGRRVRSWPDPPPLFRIKPGSVIDDLADPLHDMYIVSDRLRQFLELEAPGAAQYLPMRLDGPGVEEITAPYWVMNFIRVFDCLDEEASIGITEEGKPRVEVCVIDPLRIPPDGVLGIVKGYEVNRIIRGDLKRKIEKAGFTGVTFFDLASIDRAETLNFEKVGRPIRRRKP